MKDNYWDEMITTEFFSQTTVEIAQHVLGAYLVRSIGETNLVGRIVEVEAYLPVNDLAAHTYSGRTPRTEVLYGQPGRSYIYAIHKHHCFNLVTDGLGVPGCVLIRALEPIKGIDLMYKHRGIDNRYNLTNGPGKLCQALNITRELNNIDITCIDSPIYLCFGADNLPPQKITTTTRIGISKSKELMLRFYITDNIYVSKRKISREA